MWAKIQATIKQMSTGFASADMLGVSIAKVKTNVSEIRDAATMRVMVVINLKLQECKSR